MKKIFKIMLGLGALSLILSGCNTKGEVGPQGEQGTPGLNGKDGINGVDGRDGTMMLTGHGEPSSSLGNNGDSYIDLDTWDYYVKENNNWVKQGNIKGDDGEKGSDGEKGDDGDPSLVL